MFSSLLSRAAAAALCIGTALAQSGTIDQVSPFPGTAQTASFNGSASSLIWQQEVQVGLAGQLEGFELFLNGTVGASFDVRVRLGGGWNIGPVVFSTLLVQSNSNFPAVEFVNTTAANIQLTPGSLFVIEIQGNNSAAGFVGTYAPPPAAPQYAPFLYLNGPGCFADCGWRMAFTTYMLTGPAAPSAYCTSGTTSSGCAASVSASANPSVSSASPCQIQINSVEGQRTGIIFYGLAAQPLPWCTAGGSSFLCVKPPTLRTGTQSTGGTNGACDGQLVLDWNAFQAATPGALGAPWSVGAKAFVQGWFRDPPACKTTSLSNAIELTYVP